MRQEVRDAIESARGIETGNDRLYRPVEVQPRRSFEGVRATVLGVIRELPDDMTMAELRDELEIAANQKA